MCGPGTSRQQQREKNHPTRKCAHCRICAYDFRDFWRIVTWGQRVIMYVASLTHMFP